MYRHLAQYYDEMISSDIDYEKYANWIERCFHTADRPIKNLLDLGCGTGNVAIPLGLKGYDVTGVDLSGEMLAAADEKAFEQGIRLQWIQKNAVDFCRTQGYDAVIATMDLVNYVLNKRDLDRVLSNVYESLRPGGLFLFDINTPYRLEKVYGNEAFDYVEERYAYMWHCSFDQKEQISTFDITFFVQKEVEDCYLRFDETHRPKSYSETYLKQELKKTGFKKISASPFLFGKGLSLEEEKRVILGVKPL